MIKSIEYYEKICNNCEDDACVCCETYILKCKASGMKRLTKKEMLAIAESETPIKVDWELDTHIKNQEMEDL